jgi:hypothetical protein
MNSLNERRAKIIADQFFNLRPEDATPTAQFNTRSTTYTLIAHLPDEINNHIYAIVGELKPHFPEHYYYSPSQCHTTIVPVPHTLKPEQIIERVSPVLKNWRLSIHAHGVVANRLQAGIVFYPGEETLIPQRMRLRAVLGIPEQTFTAHNPILEELLWSNFMRFTVKPTDKLLETLRSHINDDLGGFVLSRYELYEISTVTLDPTSSKLLHTFDV